MQVPREDAWQAESGEAGEESAGEGVPEPNELDGHAAGDSEQAAGQAETTAAAIHRHEWPREQRDRVSHSWPMIILPSIDLSCFF